MIAHRFPAGVLGPSNPLVAAPGDMTTLVVHCSDGRFGNQCDRFVHCRLQQTMYDRLIVPGGAAWLAHHAELHHEVAAARTALELLVEVHRLSRVVLIAHAGCAFYLQKLGVPVDRCESRQRADLVAAGRWLHGCVPHLHVSAYFAQRRGARVEFRPVYGAGDETGDLCYSRLSLPLSSPVPAPARTEWSFAWAGQG